MACSSRCLTGAEAVGLAAIAEMLSELTGRTIRRVLVDDEDYLTRLTDRGLPEPFAQMFLGSFHASRRGEFAVSDPALERLIGRPATPLRDVLASTRAPAH